LVSRSGALIFVARGGLDSVGCIQTGVSGSTSVTVAVTLLDIAFDMAAHLPFMCGWIRWPWPVLVTSWLSTHRQHDPASDTSDLHKSVTVAPAKESSTDRAAVASSPSCTFDAVGPAEVVAPALAPSTHEVSVLGVGLSGARHSHGIPENELRTDMFLNMYFITATEQVAEALIPSAYLAMYVANYYGKNAHYMGGIRSSRWHYKAPASLESFLANAGILAALELLSSIFMMLILRRKSACCIISTTALAGKRWGPSICFMLAFVLFHQFCTVLLYCGMDWSFSTKAEGGLI
jgi:hypothetical protein